MQWLWLLASMWPPKPKVAGSNPAGRTNFHSLSFAPSATPISGALLGVVVDHHPLISVRVGGLPSLCLDPLVFAVRSEIPRCLDRPGTPTDVASAAPPIGSYSVRFSEQKRMHRHVAGAAQHLAFREFGCPLLRTPGPHAVTDLLSRIAVMDVEIVRRPALLAGAVLRDPKLAPLQHFR